tara:strand:+ start:319 stop:504 length:186 start_codon:yes stop_codon:yes gene_type:complete
MGCVLSYSITTICGVPFFVFFWQRFFLEKRINRLRHVIDERQLVRQSREQKKKVKMHFVHF